MPGVTVYCNIKRCKSILLIRLPYSLPAGGSKRRQSLLPVGVSPTGVPGNNLKNFLS